MNISSVVVYTKEENLNNLIDLFQKSDQCDYFLNDDKGRIIVTIEGEGISEEIEKLNLIKSTPNVLDANIMFSYSSDELEAERNKINLQEDVPAWLNEENIKAENIKYKGDLKNKDFR